MIKKLIKHNDNLVLIIDRPIIDLLKLTEETEVKIRTDGVDIIITPIHGQKTSEMRKISDNPKLQKIYEDILEKYDAVFRKLSKN